MQAFIDYWQLLAVIFLGICLLNIALRGAHGSYTYDTRNPYRRWCDRCGQQQSRYGFTSHPESNGWWESNGRWNDVHCSCHLDVPEQYRPGGGK